MHALQNKHKKDLNLIIIEHQTLNKYLSKNDRTQRQYYVNLGMFRIFSLSHAPICRGQHAWWRSQNITAIRPSRRNKIMEHTVPFFFRRNCQLAWQIQQALLPERLSYTKCPAALNSSDIYYAHIVATPNQCYYTAYRSVYGGTVQQPVSDPDIFGSPHLEKWVQFCLDKTCLISHTSQCL
jgi:hypothetical protein